MLTAQDHHSTRRKAFQDGESKKTPEQECSGIGIVLLRHGLLLFFPDDRTSTIETRGEFIALGPMPKAKEN